MILSQSSTLSDGRLPIFGSKCKVYNDPVHNHILMDEWSLKFVDTPEFQRLRDLKQLGSSYYVFPGASHNRFEHSVGVMHLSRQLIDKIAMEQPELEVEEWERRAVRLAGLCHDLGHGPFSHVFDNEFIPRIRPGSTWSHEKMSFDMLDVMVEDNCIDIESDEVAMIKNLIMGAKSGPKGILRDESRAFIYEIVANGRNSIDVDKFDYLVRDSLNLGIKCTYDFTRLMNYNRVIDGRICFNAKEVYNVYELFHTRYSLFKQIYVHRAAKAIELMITDVMLEADRVWDRRLSNAIDDPREYCKLTDYVLKEVEISSNPELEVARDLIHKIRTRNLYRFVDEYLLPPEIAKKIPKVKPEDISTHNKTPDVDLRPDDIIIHDLKLNYGNKDKNPVDLTEFYRDTDLSRSFKIPSERVSYILPKYFQERIVRVYSRSSDDTIVRAVQRAFRAFLASYKRNIGTSPDPNSRMFKSPSKAASSQRSARPRPGFSMSQPMPVRTSRKGLLSGGGGGGGGGSGKGYYEDGDDLDDPVHVADFETSLSGSLTKKRHRPLQRPPKLSEVVEHLEAEADAAEVASPSATKPRPKGQTTLFESFAKKPRLP